MNKHFIPNIEQIITEDAVTAIPTNMHSQRVGGLLVRPGTYRPMCSVPVVTDVFRSYVHSQPRAAAVVVVVVLSFLPHIVRPTHDICGPPKPTGTDNNDRPLRPTDGRERDRERDHSLKWCMNSALLFSTCVLPEAQNNRVFGSDANAFLLCVWVSDTDTVILCCFSIIEHGRSAF